MNEIIIEKDSFIEELYKNKLYFDQLNFFILNSHNESVIKLQKIMINKTIISSFNNVILSLYNWMNLIGYTDFIKISSKKFILMWLIVAYPDFVLDVSLIYIINNPNSTQSIIYNTSKKILYILNDILNKNHYDDNEFINHYIKYTNIIIEFIIKDKLHHIDKLKKEYISINNVIKNIEISNKYNNNEKNNSIDELNKSKILIINHLKKIDSSLDLNYY